jgi:RING finger protein 113A
MSQAESTSAPLVTFKKPRGRPQTSKRRSPSPQQGSSPPRTDEPTVIRPEKRQAPNPLIQGSSKRLRDKEREERERELSDLAWRAEEVMRSDNFATRSADWDLESKPDEVARKVRLNEVSLVSIVKSKLTDQDGEIEDGMYHGAANSYKSHIATRPDGSTSKFKAGPVRATANIRSISIIDYQPDVCKDYKGEYGPVVKTND